MTREELKGWLQQQLNRPADDRLVDQYLQSHPNVKVDAPTGQGFKLLPTAIRLVPSVAGSLIGALGGPPGEVAGGAIGTGAGETLAQIYEFLTSGEKFRPSEIAAATAIGAIPFGGEASILKTAAKSAGVGALSSGIQDVVGKGEVPDVEKALLSAGVGGVLGAGGASVAKLLRKPEQALAEGVTHVHPADTVKVGPPPTAEELNPEKVVEEVRGGLRQVNPTPGYDYPGVRPRTESELRSFESVKHFPEDQREAFMELLDQSGKQRREVQPIARLEAAATQRIVPLDLLKPGSTMKAEDVIAHRNAWTSITAEIQELEPKVASGAASPAELRSYQQKLDQAKVIGLNWTGATTEAARVLRVQREEAQRVALMDSEKLATLMESPKYKDDLAALAKDRLATKGDPVKELELFLKNRQPGAMKYTQAYLYNSILSGIKTPLRKTIGDAMNLMANFAIHPFAWGADIARNAITGAPREVYLGEMSHQLHGVFSAIPEAIKEMTFVLGHGYSLKNVEQFVEEGVESLDRLPTELPGGYITNFPLRNLKGVTAFFHELAYQQELRGAAYAKALQAGKRTPGQIQEFMVGLLTGTGESSSQVFEQAQKFAKRATFMDPAGPYLQAFMNMKAKAPAPVQVALTFIAPVVRLPGKVLQRGLETSPVGFMMQGARAGGREGAQALGRAAMGTMALAPFMALAAMGKISGHGPDDPRVRDALYEKGWRPNSIKIGNTWVEFHLMQPFATELAIAASAWDRFNEGPKSDQEADDAWDAAGRALAGGAKSTLDQSYFSSLSSFLRAIQEPDRFWGTFARGLAQDVVPYSGFMRNVAQANDPVLRKPTTAVENVESIIPGLSGNVPPRLTRFGQPVIRPGGSLQRGVNPVGVSEERPDKVQQMLDELKVNLGSPSGKLTVKGKSVHLNQDDKFALQVAQGQAHRQALEHLQDRKGVTDKMVHKVLSRATEDVDRRAASLLRRGERLTPQKLLRKSDLDALYEAYQRSHEQ